MKIDIIEDYIYMRKLNLNLTEQQETAHKMYKIIQENFIGQYFKQEDLITKLYYQYNYLLYPLPGIAKLYNAIKETFHGCNKDRIDVKIYDEYHIQCWLNFYNKGQYIDWHGHFDSQFNAWHGLYCVDVEPNSQTVYKIPNKKENIEIESKNNLLIINPSNGDVHKSSEWNCEERARITVAFDIVPTKFLQERYNYLSSTSDLLKHGLINHWIPI